MADLVSKYFQEDLSEAEDQALSETLRHSPEDSLRFEDGLREAYLRYGLPDPQWPGNPNDYPGPIGSGRWRTWLWLTLGVSLAAVLAWYFLKKDRGDITPPAKLPAPRHRPSDISKSKPGAVSSVGHSTGISELDSGNSPATTGPARATPPAAPVLPVVVKAVSPPEAQVPSSASQAHKGLEVTVRQAAPGQVTVRVLDADGTQAAFLYQGVLPAGNWVFDWDGKLSGGTPAQPGSYRIQATSGNITREKIVFIRKHGAE